MEVNWGVEVRAWLGFGLEMILLTAQMLPPPQHTL